MVEPADILLEKKKSDSLTFPFLVSSGDKNKGHHFMNNYVGLPAIPLIGKYGRNGYEINDVKALIVIEGFYNSETTQVHS